MKSSHERVSEGVPRPSGKREVIMGIKVRGARHRVSVLCGSVVLNSVDALAKAAADRFPHIFLLTKAQRQGDR
jgi:hypothetical protein